MLTKQTIYNAQKYCCEDISKIEGYNEAIHSDERYCCHHKNGIYKSHEELKEKGLYYYRPPEELMFMSEFDHKCLHKKNKYTRQKNLRFA